MEILTDTRRCAKIRQTMLELPALPHPMELPDLRQGGACELQAWPTSGRRRRTASPRIPGPTRPWTSALHRARRAQVRSLQRCVRVCHEVRGVTVLGAMHRGHLKEIGTYFAQAAGAGLPRPYNCEFCGACIDICRRGAEQPAAQVPGAQLEGTGADRLPFCSVGCLIFAAGQGERAGPVRPREGVNNEDQACFRAASRWTTSTTPARDPAAAAPRRRARPGHHGAAIAALVERVRPETPVMA